MHRVLNLLNIDFSIQSLLCYLICIKGSFTLFRLKTQDQKLCVGDVCIDLVAGSAVKCQPIWECWRTEYIFFVWVYVRVPYDISTVLFQCFDVDILRALIGSMGHIYTFFRVTLLAPQPRFNIKTIFLGMGIPMLKIRQSHDRLIFNISLFQYKDYLSRYGDPHVKDKTVSWPSYL